MKARNIKKELFDKLRKDDILAVIFELRKIIKPGTQTYKDLLSLSFRYHSVKNTDRIGTIAMEAKNVELNKITSALCSLIDEIDDALIYEAQFEDSFKQAVDSQRKTQGTHANRKTSKSLGIGAKLKNLTLGLFGFILFLFNGNGAVNDLNGSTECNINEFQEDIEGDIFLARIETVFDKLNHKIDQSSPHFRTIAATQQRYSKNIRGYKMLNNLDNDEYLVERQKICNSLIDILTDLACEDLKK